jgi:hypothetical protein
MRFGGWIEKTRTGREVRYRYQLTEAGRRLAEESAQLFQMAGGAKPDQASASAQRPDRLPDTPSHGTHAAQDERP